MFSDSNLYCNFVKASSSSSYETWKKVSSNDSGQQGTFTGVEAKKYYEDIISLSTTRNYSTENLRNGDYVESIKQCRTKEKKESYSVQKDKFNSKRFDKKHTRRPSRETKEKSHTKFTCRRQENIFLQYSQNGNLDELKKLLRGNDDIDINTVDQYGWTGLMCAAFSGKIDVVRFLLDKEALWKDIVSSKGQTALDLAKLAKHDDVCELLENWESIKRESKRRVANAQSSVFWCSVCQQEFTEDVKKHQSSTVHQFNCQHKPKETYYGIADNNPGYKMMVKSGWNEEKGDFIKTKINEKLQVHY